VATVSYVACQVGLAAHALHRWAMLLAPRRRPAPPPAPWWAPGAEPHVLVQLPVRDEPHVVDRLVRAAAALDWPAQALEIQLLDDSNGAAVALGAAAVAEARSRGLHVVHVRREEVRGFKAGALAHGLDRSEAPFVAVFDADFVPTRDFLRRTLPRFADAGLGVVQARWGHLNRDAGLLTRAQAAMLDAHFLVEHPWREATGRFLNFNGTAGVWRRACIEAAGGWSHDTLTEDLDLSVRAQLAGWRFTCDPDLVVPAELPGDVGALLGQQERWARGALQTARKLLGRVFAAPLPGRVKLEAALHLGATANYLLLLGLATSLVPVLAGPGTLTLAGALLAHAAFVSLGTLPVALYLAAGARRAGRSRREAAGDALAALVLCAGLAPRVARAALSGLLGPGGTFHRTPKSGARGRERAVRRHLALRLPEASLALAAAGAGAWAVAIGRPAALPLYGVLAAGLAWVALGRRPRPAGRT